MHPCDAKGIFFSEVEVLRVAQSKRSRAGAFHVVLDGVGPGACGGAARVTVLFSQNAYFCFFMCIRFALLFFSIYSNPLFVCIFTNAFPYDLVLPTWLRHGGVTFEFSK